ncbi:MAG TPA: transporter substrate-binding domain-containing protein, partial [Planctomycetota bacterium]|nr:transporter substrate-binding domain-containing protein [Planctomycetota bacterium]
EVAYEIVTGERFGMMMPKDSPLLEPVNDAISAMKEDGTMAALYERWMGTAPAEGITIEVTLDDGMQLVRAAGPTNGRAEENKILFKPLDTLEPDATATWRLVIQSKKVGDLRLGASLTSSRLQRPVIVTESTQFYE